jgi:hypothetical protein
MQGFAQLADQHCGESLSGDRQEAGGYGVVDRLRNTAHHNRWNVLKGEQPSNCMAVMCAHKCLVLKSALRESLKNTGWFLLR